MKPKKPKHKKTKVTKNKTHPPQIYLIYNKKNKKTIKNLKDYLFDQNLKISLPTFKTKKKKNTQSTSQKPNRYQYNIDLLQHHTTHLNRYQNPQPTENPQLQPNQ